MDKRAGIPAYSNNFFDLAIVDPPYGISESNKDFKSRATNGVKARLYTRKDWDKEIPKPDYFYHLRRVSKKQIIWGGNFFLDYLPATRCMIVWDKDRSNDFADCELAWTNFKTAVRKYKYRWNGMIHQEMKYKEIRIHPTQKPVKLYEALLRDYAKPGDIILDTHVGSASSLIACKRMGFSYVGFEKDKEYYELSTNRMKKGIQQLIF